MKGMLKLVSGMVMGAAIGASIYLLLSNENDEGVISDVKYLVNEVLEEGRQAAAARRVELEIELSQSSSASELSSDTIDSPSIA